MSVLLLLWFLEHSGCCSQTQLCQGRLLGRRTAILTRQDEDHVDVGLAIGSSTSRFRNSRSFSGRWLVSIGLPSPHHAFQMSGRWFWNGLHLCDSQKSQIFFLYLLQGSQMLHPPLLCLRQTIRTPSRLTAFFMVVIVIDRLLRG